MRRFLAGSLLAACSFGVRAETVAKLPSPTSYVSDFAGVIDPASKLRMEELCHELDTQAHAQVAVVTIHSLEGETAAEFANQLEDKWKVGPKASDRGLIMLFAVDDHKRWIEVGYGLEGILNDAKVGDIGRSMVPQLKAGQYGPAIYGGLQQIAQDIATDANVTLAAPQQQLYHRERAPGMRIGSILKLVIFAIVIISIFSGRGRGGGGWLWFLLGSMMGSGGGGGRDDGFGGGGGGNSDGGGFGGFGGGSSGGGGAGGDWYISLRFCGLHPAET